MNKRAFAAAAVLTTLLTALATAGLVPGFPPSPPVTPVPAYSSSAPADFAGHVPAQSLRLFSGSTGLTLKNTAGTTVEIVALTNGHFGFAVDVDLINAGDDDIDLTGVYLVMNIWYVTRDSSPDAVYWPRMTPLEDANGNSRVLHTVDIQGNYVGPYKPLGRHMPVGFCWVAPAPMPPVDLFPVSAGYRADDPSAPEVPYRLYDLSSIGVLGADRRVSFVWLFDLEVPLTSSEPMGWFAFQGDYFVRDRAATAQAASAALEGLSSEVASLALEEFEAPNEKSASGRRTALSSQLEGVLDLVEDEEWEDALGKLESIRAKVDGDPDPRDWLTGDAAAELLGWVDALLAEIEYLAGE